MSVLNHNYDRPFCRFLIHDHALVNFLLFFLLILPYATAQTGRPPPPAEPFSAPGPQFNPTLAIVTVILVSVFFLIGFFSVYIRRCAERRFPHTNSNSDPYAVLNAGADRRSRGGFRGLDESVINTFPTFLYSEVKGLKMGNWSLECAVCLNEFEDDETLRLIPKCSHVFHTECIDAWLSSHNTCPVCRANLVLQPDETLSSDIQMFNPDGDSAEPEQRSDNIQDVSQTEQGRDVEYDEVNLTNENRPPRSRSTGLRLTGLFPRSHSTGHSLVQPGENCERFTLRLPEGVRNQLMDSSLSRSKSCVAFPRVRSSRRGFRSGSGGFGRGRSYNFYERFDRPSRSSHWGLSLTPPFISRTGSVRSQKPAGNGVEVTCGSTTKSLFKSVKSPLDPLSVGVECDGERTFDSLRPDNQV